mgnify:CR=1 FL=1
MKNYNLDNLIVTLKREVEHIVTDVVLKSNFDKDNIRKKLTQHFY